MSKVLKCDRCGGEYGSLTHANDYIDDWREVSFWRVGEDYEPTDHVRSFHLCEGCSGDVVTFIEGREGR